MSHLALYRLWRPQNFKDVVGQEHITKTLQNALKDNRFSHAYLFSGPRGTGKTSTAKIFAKAVNCEQGISEEPCNICNTCQGINYGNILDVVEIDAASNRGVEEIRDLREKVKFAPSEVKYKVYIIDEVHMLTTEAFNALLKTLEEPPSHVIFILATTEPHKLPLTIISRCQRFDFRRIPSEKITERLKTVVEDEKIKIDDQALSLISNFSEGGMRDALSLLDQVISFSGDQIGVNEVLGITGRVSRESFNNLAKSILENNTVEVLKVIDELILEGKEPTRIMEDLLYYYRDILLYKSAPSLEEIKEKIIIDKNLPELAESYNTKNIYLIIETLNNYLNEIKRTNHTRVILEISLIKIINMLSQNEVELHISNKDIEELNFKISELEKKITKLKENSNSKEKDNNIENSQTHVNTKTITNSNATSTLSELNKLREGFSEENLTKINQVWPKILLAIKEKKITVHAWLVDGIPVAISDDVIIIAFNNVMHRDTTDKKVNKELIEQVVYEILNKRFKIINIMQNDWHGFLKENKNNKHSYTEHFNNELQVVSKAIEYFGNDLVELKEEK